MTERGPLDFDDGAPGEDEEPPRAAAPPPRRRSPMAIAPARSYVWVVGIAALVLVVVLFASTIRNGTDRGARGIPDGEAMPPFAVPTATGKLDGDANLATQADEGQAGRVPACEVRGPDVLNGCTLQDAGPVVLAFFTVRNKECIEQVDVLDQARAQLPGVQLAAIAIRGDRGDLRKLVADHGWKIPIGYDRDGALSNAYHVQVCPQITFARPGGRVAATTFGTLPKDDLVARARELGGT
ncbi:TlpA family protein disulfide reductase [Baekduia sp. Peel2402]|uniref:TlpA family protein disulfide reductase n=1 Tax=Baekduia sp. Peel2402 TaxID=3458296 RepID=UPI00403EDBE6